MSSNAGRRVSQLLLYTPKHRRLSLTNVRTAHPFCNKINSRGCASCGNGVFACRCRVLIVLLASTRRSALITPGVVLREEPISRRSVLLRSQFQPPIVQRHDPKPEACRALFQAAHDLPRALISPPSSGRAVGDVVAAIVVHRPLRQIRAVAKAAHGGRRRLRPFTEFQAIAHRPCDGDQAFFDAAQSRCLGQDQRRNGKSLSLTT